MSNTNDNSVTTIDVRQETTNYAVIRYPAKEAGKPPVDKMVDAESTEVKQIEADNYTGDGIIMFKQEVIFPLAGSMRGAEQIIPDETTRYQMLNASIKSRAATGARKELLATDEAGNLIFEASAEPFDLTEAVSSPYKKSKKSPTEKALAALAGLGLSNEELTALILKFKDTSDSDDSDSDSE